MPQGKRQFRQRRSSSSDEEEVEHSSSPVKKPTTAVFPRPVSLMPSLDTILRDAKELQKMRQRPHGVTAASLAMGDKLKRAAASTAAAAKMVEEEEEDPWKTGGLIDPKASAAAKDRNRDRTEENEKDVVNMGNTFAAETNQRDEDAEMCKYIEEEMARRRRGRDGGDADDAEQDPLELDPVFRSLPEHLKMSYRKKGEEMLSSQMLSGIPEVDLGINEKIRNIEETEKAKKSLLDRKMAEKLKPSTMSLAPANMAVDFVQHNRFNLEDNKPKREVKQKEKQEEKPAPLVVGMTEKNPALASATAPDKKKHKPDSATDDYHFDKFKKAMRR